MESELTLGLGLWFLNTSSKANVKVAASWEVDLKKDLIIMVSVHRRDMNSISWYWEE